MYCSLVSLSSRVFKRARFSSLYRKAVVLAFVGLFFCAFDSKADQIVVGVLSFDSIIPPSPNGAPGTNGFTIYNFTGANSQPGTPDSTLNFLNTSLLLNGTQAVAVGTVTPGSEQPAALQFPTTTLFTDAMFDATLDTTSFTISGQNYVASSSTVTADLAPSTPPDLAAGTDFVLLEINASLSTVTTTPEPSAFWLALGPLASLLWLRARRAS